MGMYIKLYKKIITSVKIISKLIFKFQFHQKRAHDIWRAVRSHPTHPSPRYATVEYLCTRNIFYLINGPSVMFGVFD